VPLLAGRGGPDHTVFLDQPLGQYIEEMYGLVADGHKLIHSLTGNRFQLFDLEADPGETADLARTAPELLARMKDRYQRFRAALDLRADRYRPK
jgi:arylsulfatase A-like enzyme